MDYQRIYNKLIERAETRMLDGYYEMHHIIPKCMGGADTKDNLIKLTAREHYVMHQLLCKLYPNHRGLAYAALMMTVQNKSQHILNDGCRSNNRLYEWIRIKINNFPMSPETKEKLRQANLGRKHTAETKRKISENSAKFWLGKTHSPPTKKKMSDAKTGSKHHMWRQEGHMKGKKHTEEAKKQISESLKKAYNNGTRTHSEETLQKIANSNKGKHNITHDDETKQVIADASRSYWKQIKLLQIEHPEYTIKEIRQMYTKRKT